MMDAWLEQENQTTKAVKSTPELLLERIEELEMKMMLLEGKSRESSRKAHDATGGLKELGAAFD